MVVYFIFNLSLTIYNKAVMQFYQFPFPWTLTSIHALCGSIGCYAMVKLGAFQPAVLTAHEQSIMVAFSLLYTINIAISNVSLNMVSIPVKQKRYHSEVEASDYVLEN